MNKVFNNDKQAEDEKENWLKKKAIPLLTLLLVIAITFGIFLFGRNPERVADLEKYRYLGAFLISLIGNASVLLPCIVLPILTALGVDFYQTSGELAGPIMIGLAGGAAAAIGEMTGYMVGYSGRKIVEKSKMYTKLENQVRRRGAIAIFILSLVPLFFDLVGIAAGALRFPIWKFFLVCWLGRTILYVGVVVAFALGWRAVLPYFG